MGEKGEEMQCYLKEQEPQKKQWTIGVFLTSLLLLEGSTFNIFFNTINI